MCLYFPLCTTNVKPQCPVKVTTLYPAWVITLARAFLGGHWGHVPPPQNVKNSVFPHANIKIGEYFSIVCPLQNKILDMPFPSLCKITPASPDPLPRTAPKLMIDTHTSYCTQNRLHLYLTHFMILYRLTSTLAVPLNEQRFRLETGFF
jgi:hypothetical protein